LATRESEEHFAWNVALGIMGFLSLLAVGVMMLERLGYGVTLFFNVEFVVSLVYIPTLVLAGGWLAGRRKSRAESPP
jgi:predicted RND superfamily exporter protein